VLRRLRLLLHLDRAALSVSSWLTTRRAALRSVLLVALAMPSACCFNARGEGDAGTSGPAAVSSGTSAGTAGSTGRTSGAASATSGGGTASTGASHGSTGTTPGATSTIGGGGTSTGGTTGSTGTSGSAGSTSGGSSGGVQPPVCPAVFGPFPADAGCVTSADCVDPTTTCQGGICQITTCPSGTRSNFCNAAASSDGTCYNPAQDCQVTGPPGITDAYCLQGGDAGHFCCTTADRSTTSLLCPGGQLCVSSTAGSSLGTCQGQCQNGYNQGHQVINCSDAASGCEGLPCPIQYLPTPGACYPLADAGCGIGGPVNELAPCGFIDSDSYGICGCPLVCAPLSVAEQDIGLCLFSCSSDADCTNPDRICADAGFGPSYCLPTMPSCQTLSDCPAGSWACSGGVCL
jgi:hypothetical protein